MFKGPCLPSSRLSPQLGFQFRHSNPTLCPPVPLCHRQQHSGTLTSTRILAWPQPTRPNPPQRVQRDPTLCCVFDSTLCNSNFPAWILHTLSCTPDTNICRHAKSAADKEHWLMNPAHIRTGYPCLRKSWTKSAGCCAQSTPQTRAAGQCLRFLPVRLLDHLPRAAGQPPRSA